MCHEQFYHLGEPQGPLTVIGETQATGYNGAFLAKSRDALQLQLSNYKILAKRLRGAFILKLWCIHSFNR